eukprot:gene24509-29806_t
MTGIQGISIWLWKYTDQIEITQYLIDCRYDISAWVSNSAIGEEWGNIYLNGVASTRLAWIWTELEQHNERWVHVHFETSAAFSDDVNFMSRVVSGDESHHMNNLKGRIAEVMFWQRELAVWEVERAYLGFDQTAPRGTLIAIYSLEEGQGDKSYDIFNVEQELRFLNGPTWHTGAPV